MKPVQSFLHTLKLLDWRRFGWFLGQSLRRPNPAHLWEEDTAFQALHKEIESHTLTDIKRCYQLFQLAASVSAVAGDFAEVGVYRGGTARLLASLSKQQGKQLHLFDTFTGMPATHAEKDFHVEGDFAATSLEGVQAYLSDFDNCRFYPGLFPDTATPVRDLQFSFVHVDVDIYSAGYSACEFFDNRLSPGGVMIFDDYGFITTEGLRAAVDEFYATRQTRPIYVPTGQCFVLKH